MEQGQEKWGQCAVRVCSRVQARGREKVRCYLTPAQDDRQAMESGAPSPYKRTYRWRISRSPRFHEVGLGAKGRRGRIRRRRHG